MSDLSHEDIKNAILHAGETPDQVVAPVDDTTLVPEVDLPEAPHTPYEGFVGSEPTEEERVGFRAAKDQVHARHRNRTATQPERSRHRGVIAGSTVAGLLLAATGGGFLAFRGHGDGTPDQPQKSPEASAPVTPGEQVTTPKTPQEAVGTMVTDYENLNVKPTEADVERALQPVPVSQYTASEAVEEFGHKLDVLFMSGEFDYDAYTADGKKGEQTPASQVEQDKLLVAMFGNQAVDPATRHNFDDYREVRRALSVYFDYYDNSEKYLNTETHKEEYATQQTWFDITSEGTKTNGYTFQVLLQVATNLGAVDRDQITRDNPTIGQSQSRSQTIQLQIVSGNWQIATETAN